MTQIDPKLLVKAIVACVDAARSNDKLLAEEGSCPTCGGAVFTNERSSDV